MRLRSAALVSLLLALPSAAVWMALGEGEVEVPTLVELPPDAALRAQPSHRRRVAALPSLSGRREPLTRRRHVRRDPLRRAFDGSAHQARVDARRFLGSEVSQVFLDCMPRGDRRKLDELKEVAGVDLLEAIDQLAVAEETLVFTGDFTGVDWGALLPEHARREEADTLVYEGRPTLAVRGRLHVFGRDLDHVQPVLDRLDSPEPVAPELAPPPTPPGYFASMLVPADTLLEPLSLPWEIRGPIRSALRESGVQAWVTVRADEGMRVGVELLHEDGTALSTAEEALLSAAGAAANALGPNVMVGEGRVDVDLDEEQVRKLLRCERDQL